MTTDPIQSTGKDPYEDRRTGGSWPGATGDFARLLNEYAASPHLHPTTTEVADDVYDELVERYGSYPQGNGDLPDHDNSSWILVEESRHDGCHYLTAHESPQAAVDYHATQEYPEDWIPQRIVQLSTGLDFVGTLVPSTPPPTYIFEGDPQLADARRRHPSNPATTPNNEA